MVLRTILASPGVPSLAVSTPVWAATVLAVVAVSLFSFVGVLLLLVRPRLLQSAVPVLVSFAVGALLGDALVHILPELAEDGGLTAGITFVTVGGILGFFAMEKWIHWHHALHADSGPAVDPVAVTNLVGDGVHNFVDGALVAGAFLASVPLGITTALAVALHEIPQELGDFGVLVHAGLPPKKALLFNFLSALLAVAGAVLTLLMAGAVEGVARPLLAVTAGGFIYIAGADLIPELHRDTSTRTSLLQFVGIMGGFGVMGLLLLLE